MKGWFRAKDAAAYCSVSERTLRDWLKQDLLRYSKVRGTVLIKKSWIDAFLEAAEVTDSSGPDIDRIVEESMEGLI